MKNSKLLNVETNLYVKNDIIIHPNEGYDLGLLSHSTPVKIFTNTSIDIFKSADEDFIDGVIILENGCRQGNIQLSKKCWNLMGKPEKVILYYENNKILISNF